MRSDPEVLSIFSTGSPAWVAFYLASTIGMTLWMRRREFRQGGRACVVAALDVLSSASLAIPALAYWDSEIGDRLGNGLLLLLFGFGLLGLFGFVVHDARTMLRHPRMTARQRRRFAAIGAAAVLLPSSLEMWWGVEALAHIHASPEELAQNGSLTPV
jgi:hypothetical protein